MTQKQNSKKKKGLIIALLIFAGIILALAVTYAVLFFSGKNQLFKKGEITIPEDVNASIDNDTEITFYNGVKYKRNKNVTNILFIGVDNEDFEENEVYGKNGQADALYLMAIDTKKGNIDVIGISRDSIADVRQYSVEGNYINTKRQQVCLAYSNGDGMHKSCENTVESVSGIMCGLPINSYYALDFKAIPVINDAVGGVTVTANEDLSGKKISFKKGDIINLNSNNVLAYLRTRDHVTVESNMKRVERQFGYIKGFWSKVKDMTKRNISAPVNIYNKMQKYSVTDINPSKVAYLTSCVFENRNDIHIDFHTLKGESILKDGYAEYHLDNTAVFETVLDVFYEEAE